MGNNSFAPWSSNPNCFIVQNIGTNPKKTIRIFNYPINYNGTRDLIKIPGVAESDIRASLLKGELNHKIKTGEIVVLCSDIDLTQYNFTQQVFLQSAGITDGLLIGSNQITQELNDRINSGGGGSSNIIVKSAEINFGTTPVDSKTFTINDSLVNTSSKVMVLQSGNAPTGNNVDENELTSIVFSAASNNGYFTLMANSINGPITNNYKIYYIVAN